MSNTNYPVLYVFVNTDLPSMNPGKAQAHSGHAANAFIHQHVIKPMRNGVTEVWSPVAEWMAATPFGFGTQINLKGTWRDVINTAAQVEESKYKEECCLVILPCKREHKRINETYCN